MPVTRDATHYRVSLSSSSRIPIVLIHGAGGSTLSWPPSIRNLPGQTVYTIDLSGHGNSTISSANGIPRYVDQVIRFLDAIHLSKAIFVGHSMGGAVALLAAYQHPDRVAGLGLISTAANLRLPDEIRDLMTHPLTYTKLVDAIIERSFSGSTPRNVVKAVKKRLLEERQAVLINDLTACDGFNINERLSMITQPCVIIAGDSDGMTPLPGANHLRQHLPNSEIRILSGKGHMLMIESPDEVAKGLLELANEVEA